MRAAVAVVVALLVLVATGVWRALSGLCQEEIETRISRLPRTLIGLAALRVPGDVRSDLVSEWAAELDFIVSGTDGLPVTRLLRGLGFAGSLLRVAPSVARELAGIRRGRLEAAFDAILRLGMLLGVLGGAIGAAYYFTHHHTVGGISAVCMMLASVLCWIAMDAWAVLGWLSLRAGLIYALGALVAAASLFLRGQIVEGFALVVVALACGSIASVSALFAQRAEDRSEAARLSPSSRETLL